MSTYQYTGPVDCNRDFDASIIQHKTAVVTGGASGIGEAYVRALCQAGALVCVGDLNVERGEKLQSEFANLKFVKCNTADWNDQVQLFRTAAECSPSGKIHYVVANAGVAPRDEVFSYSGDGKEPEQPNLKTIEVNVHGALYTTHLALHHFIKQNGQTPSPTQDDTCLILIGSGAAFLDVRGPQYVASKWAMRGIMHSLRGTAFHYGSRVNMISPWYVRTNILSKDQFDHVASVGVDFATPEDAGQCLLRILSDRSVNGRTLFLSPRKWAPRGYIDLDVDDYPDRPLLQEIQAYQVKSAPFEAGLFV